MTTYTNGKAFKPRFMVMMVNEGKYGQDHEKAGQTFRRAEGLVQTAEGGPFKAASLPIRNGVEIAQGQTYELDSAAFLNEKGKLQFYVATWALISAKPAAAPARDPLARAA